MNAGSGDRGRGWLIATLAGIVLYVALDAVAQSLPPHYSPVSQAESDLAVGAFGYIMALNFINRGLLSLCFIAGLTRSLDRLGIPRSDYRPGRVLMVIWAAGAVVLALFQTDVPPAHPTLHGTIHLVVALVAFVAGAAGTLALTTGMKKSGRVAGLVRMALPVAAASIVSVLLELLLPIAAPHLALRIGGLVERIFLGTVLLWMAVVSLWLIAARGTGH